MISKELESDIIRHIRSFEPIVRDFWWVKFSTYKDNILIFVASTLTGQMKTRYFTDEDKACIFVNWVLDQDPSKSLNLNEKQIKE